MKNIRSCKGFSLIELMIAMVAGLVVIGAVVVFTAATAQSSSANIRSTRVMQNLRSSMSLIEREIRRSGFDETALTYAGSCSSASSSLTCPTGSFNRIIISSGSCLVVSYDNAANASPGTPGTNEYHGFRLKPSSTIGIIQASLQKSSAPNCASTTDTDWVNVTDPNIVDITNLSFTQPSSIGGCVQQTTGMWIVVQDVLVQISGRWVDPSSHLVTTRSLEETVRVKNDFVSITKPSPPC
jgi:prepilin-type N-terminal cleavage/methylation domain-containing protein